MGLDGLFREEEALADLAIHEAVRHELKHFDLSRGRILALLPHDLWRKRDHGTVPARAAARSRGLEAPAVVAITVQDLLTLCGVHESGIGVPPVPL